MQKNDNISILIISVGVLTLTIGFAAVINNSDLTYIKKMLSSSVSQVSALCFYLGFSRHMTKLSMTKNYGFGGTDNPSITILEPVLY